MIQKKQIVRRQPLSNLSERSLHPIINRVYANRGIKSLAELDYSLKHLPRPDLLTGMNEACEILYEAVLADANVLIIGDYDVDGATSTTLTKLSLEAFGFSHVAYFIPDRMTFGYGLSTQVIEVIQAFQPDVIITVDNGISSIEGVKRAHEYGISVIITDHHLPAGELPQADAIVNPNLTGDRFPAKTLAGVGVAFYLMLGLRTFLRQQNWFVETNRTEPPMVDYLDLVALGTIADVVPFDYVNRLLVQQGLQRIRRGECRIGIKALLDQSNCELDRVNSEDIAYKVAPKINAAGRLDDMSIGVECLLSKEEQSARNLVEKLHQINQQRKDQQDFSIQQALKIVDQQINDLDVNTNSICLYHKDWHPGIVGLVASRIKDRLNIPTVIFAGDNGNLKGSARSITGVHIRDALASLASANPEIIKKFGGHAMAAGLTIEHDKFELFADHFEQQVKKQLNEETKAATILSDGQLEQDNFSIEVAELIDSSGPWGVGFDKPRFDSHFHVVDYGYIGESGNHLRFKLKLGNNDPALIDAVAFNVDRYYESTSSGIISIHCVYSLDINRYNNAQNLQIIIDYFEVNSVT